MNSELREDIKRDVIELIEEGDIPTESFEEFFDYVDTLNAYEEEWDAKKYKSIYLSVYEELKGL